MTFPPHKRALRSGFTAATATLAVFFVGCELIATVERDLIPSDTTGVGGATSTASSGAHGGAGGHGGAAPECTVATEDAACGKDAACVQHDCVGGECVTVNAKVGVTCSDGGVVCDGKGSCVNEHCMDGTLDGNESDVDCGGSCPACVDEKKCAVDDDCTSANCVGPIGGGGGDAGTCKPCGSPSDCAANRYCDLTTKACVPDRQQGAACSDASQCGMDACVDGVCCDAPCNASCSACAKSKGADEDGKCKATAVRGEQDPGACDDTKGMCIPLQKCTCDANGACKGKNNAACTKNDQCASGMCVGNAGGGGTGGGGTGGGGPGSCQ